jgi:cell division protein FtsL
MLASGKIFVVVAVLSVILVGIFLFLFTIDKKVKKLEETLKNQSKETQS